MTNMVSSEAGYFAYAPPEFAKTGMPDRWRIVRRRFGYGDDAGTVDEWSLDIELSGYAGTMIPSDDGRWLGLKAWDFVLLDAATGETVFDFPRWTRPRSWRDWRACWARAPPPPMSAA